MQALRNIPTKFPAFEELENPYAMVGVNIIAADSDEEAQWLATSLQQNILNLIRNNRVPLQPPVENIYELANDYEKAVLQQRLQTTFIGSPETIKPKLHAFLNKTNANEIIVNAQIFDHQARLHSYELVAEIVKQEQ